jgi:hypothetical protein
MLIGVEGGDAVQWSLKEARGHISSQAAFSGLRSTCAATFEDSLIGPELRVGAASTAT